MANYVFDQKDDLVSYLYSKLDNPTNMKIQKAMYLLWAFYAGTYGSLEKTADNSNVYPEYLFQSAFEAWRYGPVDNELYGRIKSGVSFDIEGQPQDFLNNHISADVTKDKQKVKNITSFLTNLIDQIDKMDDFALVARTHEDSSWTDSYIEGIKHIEMKAETIKKEYAHKLNVG